MNKSKIALNVGIGLVSAHFITKGLIDLGLIPDPATGEVNTDFQNDIAWSSKYWDSLNLETFTSWSPEHFTHYIILKTGTAGTKRGNPYSYISKWLINKLSKDNPSANDVAHIVQYINDHLYCQMEFSYILKDTEIGYPNWSADLYLNQIWWSKWLNSSNSTLLPLFQCLHNLPNYIKTNTTDPSKIKVIATAILNSQTVLKQYQ